MNTSFSFLKNFETNCFRGWIYLKAINWLVVFLDGYQNRSKPFRSVISQTFRLSQQNSLSSFSKQKYTSASISYQNISSTNPKMEETSCHLQWYPGAPEQPFLGKACSNSKNNYQIFRGRYSDCFREWSWLRLEFIEKHNLGNLMDCLLVLALSWNPFVSINSAKTTSTSWNNQMISPFHQISKIILRNQFKISMVFRQKSNRTLANSMS